MNSAMTPSLPTRKDAAPSPKIISWGLPIFPRRQSAPQTRTCRRLPDPTPSRAERSAEVPHFRAPEKSEERTSSRRFRAPAMMPEFCLSW